MAITGSRGMSVRLRRTALRPELGAAHPAVYRRLYQDHVMQANEGCDVDFLRGRSTIVTNTVTYL